MHHRRARPTLRVLQEDLSADWGSPRPLRSISEGRFIELHPLSELPHPIISRAADSFGADPADDNFVGTIAGASRLRLLEIKKSQWRGGVWEDAQTQVCWLVVAGLAKGDHEDRDDFYKRIEREDGSGDLSHWLPTPDDVRLLKQETAARLRTEWELRTQESVHDALRVIHAGGSQRIEILHPVPHRGSIARLEITVNAVRDVDYRADEILVEILPEKGHAGTALLWQLTVRVLISIEPPEQAWDRFGDTYSNIGEPGAWAHRLDSLGTLVARNQLAVSEPGSISPYAHRDHLAGKTINGEAVRSLCGAYFVPTQDHDSLPPCVPCQERLAELPK